MENALIGYTGFVGSNILQQKKFNQLYNSKNILDIQNREFDLVVCAGVSAVKWLANKEPETDWQNIVKLIDCLKTVRAKQFILISTIDVYPNPVNVDETTLIDPEQNSPYGKHRYQFEEFVRGFFPDVTIIRLPGLFGHGIKKNIIYDFIHDHEIEKINPKSQFQFYNLDNVWYDIQWTRRHNMQLINFATEPLTVGEIYRSTFGSELAENTFSTQAAYDMWSIRAKAFSGKKHYLYQRNALLPQIVQFIKNQREKL